MQLFSERLGRADRQYARESGTALPRLRQRFRAMQAWRWSDGAPAQPIQRVPAGEAGADATQDGAA
jgi:hypothetical protein